MAILDRKMVRRRHEAATLLLVHWFNSSPTDATWEFAKELQLRFPNFSLEARGPL